MTALQTWERIVRDAVAAAPPAVTRVGERVTTPRDGDGRVTGLTGDGMARVRLDRPGRRDVVLPVEDLSPALSRAERLRAAMVAPDAIAPRLDAAYLAKGWLGRRSCSVLYGEANVGKSFLATDLALHVAAGADWHGNRVRGGMVLYLAGEGGESFVNRLAAWDREHPEHRETVRRNFRFLPLALDLCGPADAEALIEALDGMEPVLIVVDTLARSMGAGDENNAADMGSLVRNIDAIREKTGAHVLLVHHAGKDAGRGARGHSSLRAAVDTEIEVTRADGVILATCTKQRDLPSGSTLACRLRRVVLGHDEDGDPVTSCVVDPTDEAPATRPGRRVSGKARVALQALSDAVLHHGRRVDSPDLPRCPVVPISRWREMCDRHGLTEAESPEARKKAFARAKDALIEAGLVRQFDGFAWKVPAGGQTGTNGDMSPSVPRGTNGDKRGHTHPPFRGGVPGCPPVPCPGAPPEEQRGPDTSSLPRSGANTGSPVGGWGPRGGFSVCSVGQP